MITLCKICGKPLTHIWRCDEHYRCDDCGTLKDLCTYCEGVLCLPCHTARVEKRIEAFDGDTDYTDEIICPYCGYQVDDSWEYADGEHKCPDCYRTYELVRDVAITYSTSKIQSKTDGQ